MNAKFNSAFDLAVSNNQQDLIELITKVANEIGIRRIALVGGVTRDSIINQIPNLQSHPEYSAYRYNTHRFCPVETSTL